MANASQFSSNYRPLLPATLSFRRMCALNYAEIVKGPTLTGSGLLRPAIASPGQRKIGVRDRRALRIARARAQIAWGSSKGVGRSGSHH